jgi:hypothetical protein
MIGELKGRQNPLYPEKISIEVAKCPLSATSRQSAAMVNPNTGANIQLIQFLNATDAPIAAVSTSQKMTKYILGLI